jgi:hypothetical protein
MITFLEYIQLFESDSPLVLYHGGKGYVSKPNLKRTQRTDRGVYGKGFYATTDPQSAAFYGPKVSQYEVSKTAKVFSTSFDPREANSSQVNDVISHHKSLNPNLTDSDLEDIKTNHSSWNKAVNDYADHHKFDMIHLSQKHYNPEIVVKNPKALRFVGKHKSSK